MEFTALEKYRAAQQSQTETFCCFERAENEYTTLLIGGRSDGALVLWRMQDVTSRYGGLSRDNKEEVLKSRRHHQGSVNALVYSEDSQFGTRASGGLLFSGSADRTIKVWDVWADKQQDETCVQTLVGHGATVTDIVCSRRGSVISCARDCTFRIWKPLPGREMLLHAFFVCAQTVTLSGSSADGWANAMSVMTVPHWSLFVGDAAGTISVFAPRQDAPSVGTSTAPSQELEQKESWSHIHQLGISVLKTVTEHNFLISISFDCKCAILDAATGTPFLKIENPRRVRFTGVVWDDHHDQLILCDHAGHFETWNTYTERVIASRQVVRPMDPKGAAVVRGGSAARAAALLPVLSNLAWLQLDTLLCISPQHAFLQQFKVSRDLRCVEYIGHTDAVVGITVLKAQVVHQASEFDETKDEAFGVIDEIMLLSASLDNTIRCWDDYDITQRFQLNETESEISCMLALPKHYLLVTGSEDGSIRWWNPDLGHMVSVCEHSNTVSCLAYAVTSREEYLFSGSYDGSIGLWIMSRARDGRLVPHLEACIPDAHGVNAQGMPNEILCLEFHHLSQCIISGGNDNEIHCWSCSDLQKKCTLHGHAEPVTCIAVDASFVFSGSEDRTILVWNLSAIASDFDDLSQDAVHPPAAVIQAHTGTVTDVMIVASAGYLISCGSDARVRVWDYTVPSEDDEEKEHDLERVGRLLRDVSCADETPQCLAFMEGGTFLKADAVTSDSQAMHISEAADPLAILVGTQGGQILKFIIPSNLCGPSSPEKDSGWSSGAAEDL